jgi:pimeloyl-ACP methyl ester carboxylesterase
MKAGTEESVHAGGLRWNVASTGPDDGPPVLLLHGFPEQWRSWRKQIAPFTEAGMRVHAADLPGYAGTDEPRDYSLGTLAEHIAGLADHLGGGPVHLVGHDWGGIVAHAVAALHPDSIRSLVVASAPHPDVLGRALRDPKQIAKSWYVGLFLIPYIEYVVGSGVIVDRIFAGASAGVHDRDDMRRALAYYRSNLAPWHLGKEPIGRIKAPGLVVHGGRDRYIGDQLMEATCEEFDDLRGYETLDAAHYLHREKPDDFNAKVIGFWRSMGAIGG